MTARSLKRELGAYLAKHRSYSRQKIALPEKFALPLVRCAWERYSRDMIDGGLRLSRDAETAMRISLRRRLATSVKILADYEWKVFLNTPFVGISAAVQNKSRLEELFFAPSVEHRIVRLTKSYPELLRIWSAQIKNWHRSFQMLNRAAKKLASRMKWNGRTGIERLQPDLSDPHHGNATVVRVRFSNGADWIYKPRPASQSAAWFKLLSQINLAGFSHPFRIPDFVFAKDHHWMEAIPQRRCLSYREQLEFWFRMGALLYLLDFLQGVDFHTGNLICSGVQPVFVDCETLLHPETRMPRRAAQERGLLRIGILPLDSMLGTNVAALGPKTFARVSTESRRLPHDRTLRAVIEGFLAMDEFLRAPARLSILHQAEDALRSSGCRILYRPTGSYYFILQQSLVPDLLADTAKRLRFLQRACRALRLPKDIIRREVTALKNLDIPLVTGRCCKALNIPSIRKTERAVQQISECLRKVTP